MLKWRLGLDLGETSVGWCAFRLDDSGQNVESFLDAGVRLFPSGREPKSNEPLAVARRLARQKRRQSDRKGKRLQQAILLLEEFGLLPAPGPKRDEVFAIDPYLARAKAAQGKASDFELGRALAHLAKRRGFRSSRKDLTEDEKTGGLLREGISKLQDELQGRTLGELLWSWQQDPVKSVRFRRGSEYYPERWMYNSEFETIKEANLKRLKEEQWIQIGERTIFYQRPLQPVERGKCSVRHDRERAPHCLPSFEYYRLWENINNLRWCDQEGAEHQLSDQERLTIFKKLKRVKDKAFPSASSKSQFGLKLPGFMYFNLESDTRPKLDGCPVDAKLSKTGFPGWDDLCLNEKDDVVALLLDIDQKQRAQPLAERLKLQLDFECDINSRLAQVAEQWGVDTATIQQLFKMIDSIGRRTGSFCPELLREVVPIMRETGAGHRHIIKEVLGYTLREDEWNNSVDFLPYYGKVLANAVMFAEPDKDPEKHFGKIGNPTVHLALNQLRLIVNELIKLYGKPEQIALELTRDLKLGKKAKAALAKIQKRNRENTERAKTKLMENNIAVSFSSLLKMKLFEELSETGVGSQCIFTGKTISMTELFSPNSSVQVEHLLPFSRTYDDGFSNKVLCYQKANTLKGNKSPFEAFGNGQYESKGFFWEDIIRRAQMLPGNKAWRFQENAMELTQDDGWLERQLNDTAYISRQASLYLQAVCSNVWCVPGRLTAFLRREWQLNQLLGDDRDKNRDDYRHHALDAFVVGLTTRSLLQFVSRASAKGRPIARELLDEHKSRGLLPLPKLRNEFGQQLDEMLVSFKPDHDVNKKFFEDTAYGPVINNDEKYNLVTRSDLQDLANVTSLRKEKKKIVRDKDIRIKLRQGTPEEAQESLLSSGIKRVRTLVTNSSVVRFPLAAPPHKKERAYPLGGYAWCDIWQEPGKEEVTPNFVSYFHARQAELDPSVADTPPFKPHPAAKLVLRIRKDDTIIFYEGEEKFVARVVKFSASANALYYCPMNQRPTKNPPNKKVSILFKRGLTKITLNPLGREGFYVSSRRNRKSRGSTS